MNGSENNARNPGDGKPANEGEIFTRFVNIAKERFSNAYGSDMKRLDELYNKSRDFDVEKKLIEEISNIGLSKGIMAGFGCFALLRLSPRVIGNYVMRRRQPGGGSTASNPFQHREPPPLPEAGTGGMTTFQGASAPTPQRPGLFIRALRLSLDLFASVTVGAYTSLYFIDTSKLLRQAAELPLVEGRSLLSEELCPDFAKEFQTYPRETWEENDPSYGRESIELAPGGKPKLASFIQSFVANCKRRAIYEEEMRSERGISENDPVNVPHPGVPRDFEISLDELLSGGGAENDRQQSLDSDDEFFEERFETNDFDEGR